MLLVKHKLADVVYRTPLHTVHTKKQLIQSCNLCLKLWEKWSAGVQFAPQHFCTKSKLGHLNWTLAQVLYRLKRVS